MADAHLDSLRYAVECLLNQASEEYQTVEDGPITLLEILLLQIHGQFLQEVILLFKIELLPDIDALLNIVIDLLLQLVRELILIRKLLESLIILTLLDILRTYITDQRTYSVDVIGQTHHAKYL
jgi:hypothetical protein